MKLTNNLTIRIVTTIVIGFLLAGAGTKITYTCVPPNGELGCTSFEKAVMHPGDLLKNKQNSLSHFSETFVITSLTSLALFTVVSSTQKKSKPTTQPKE
jgi:hypothetical protein